MLHGPNNALQVVAVSSCRCSRRLNKNSSKLKKEKRYKQDRSFLPVAKLCHSLVNNILVHITYKFSSLNSYFGPDVLGPTAFKPVKSDINGNIQASCNVERPLVTSFHANY